MENVCLSKAAVSCPGEKDYDDQGLEEWKIPRKFWVASMLHVVPKPAIFTREAICSINTTCLAGTNTVITRKDFWTLNCNVSISLIHAWWTLIETFLLPEVNPSRHCGSITSET
jgi:hypothetical protein